jgi:hypothetical protein
MPDDAGLYERDWYAWTQDQAARLRAWPEAVRPNGLDLEHLAEEVADMGKSERRAIQSFLRLIATHALKLEFHPATEWRAHWMGEIDNFRAELAVLFDESPSLFAQREALYLAAWKDAQRLVARQLAREAPGQAMPAAEAPRYALDAEVLNDEWYPAPPR